MEALRSFDPAELPGVRGREGFKLPSAVPISLPRSPRHAGPRKAPRALPYKGGRRSHPEIKATSLTLMCLEYPRPQPVTTTALALSPTAGPPTTLSSRRITLSPPHLTRNNTLNHPRLLIPHTSQHLTPAITDNNKAHRIQPTRTPYHNNPAPRPSPLSSLPPSYPSSFLPLSHTPPGSLKRRTISFPFLCPSVKNSRVLLPPRAHFRVSVYDVYFIRVSRPGFYFLHLLMLETKTSLRIRLTLMVSLRSSLSL